MEKKLILVGVKNATTAGAYAFQLANDLRYKDRIPVTSLGKYDFDTPHVRVMFVYDIREQVLDGLQADAIYGFDEYRKPLFQYAKGSCLKTNRVGLRDWIVYCEKECGESESLKALELGEAFHEGVVMGMKEVNFNEPPKPEYVKYTEHDIKSTFYLAEAWANIREQYNKRRKIPAIEKVHFSDRVTAVIWADRTKTVVRCGENDIPDPEKGLAMAIAKKALGNTGKYYDTFKDHLPAVEETEQPAPATKPVEAAYQLLVAYRDNNMIPDMGTIEEIIGHLGEALA